MMRAVLAVTEPTALPIAMSTLPSAAAIRETSISGRVVAMDTMVAPMIKVGMRSAPAIQLAASTNQSPPLMIISAPMANTSRLIAITSMFFDPSHKKIQARRRT